MFSVKTKQFKWPQSFVVALAVVLALITAGVSHSTPAQSASAKPAPKSGKSAAADLPQIDLAGYNQVLAKYKGKPLVVTFWATWCEPCRDEYPMLNELAKQYAPQGLKVVGITLDQDGDSDRILMRRFLARYKPIFPNYRKKQGDENGFIQAVMPGWNGSIPATFFYGKDGQQIGHLAGASDRET